MVSKRVKFWLFLGGLGLLLVAGVGLFQVLEGLLPEPYLIGALILFCVAASIVEAAAYRRQKSGHPGIPLAQQLSGAVGWFGAMVSVLFLIGLTALAVVLRL